MRDISGHWLKGLVVQGLFFFEPYFQVLVVVLYACFLRDFDGLMRRELMVSVWIYP